MVTGTQESTAMGATTVGTMFKLAEAGIDFSSKAEPTADLTAARGHLRNARNWLEARHPAAVYRDAQRAIEATNEAVCLAVRERFDLEVGPLRTNIEEARRLYRSAPQLEVLEDSLARLEQELFRLRPAVIHYRSQEIFAQIPGIVSRLDQRLNNLRLEQLQRERFETKAEQISNILQGIRDSYPQADQTVLRWLEEELCELRKSFGRQTLPQILQGFYLRDLDDLLTRVEEFRSKLSAAFRPPSTKKVPQRGRPRAPKRSSHGPGRHSRR